VCVDGWGALKFHQTTEADQTAHACAQAAAVQRILLGASEYRLAEESGYKLDTVITMAPSRRSLAVLGGPSAHVGSELP